MKECRLERVNRTVTPLFLPLQEEAGQVNILRTAGRQADQFNRVRRGTLGFTAYAPQGNQAGRNRLLHPFFRSLTGSETRDSLFQPQGDIGKGIRDIRHLNLHGSV